MNIFKSLSDKDWPKGFTCLLILSNTRRKKKLPATTFILASYFPKLQKYSLIEEALTSAMTFLLQ